MKLNPEEYAKNAVIARETALEMISHLELITLKPSVIVDYSCRDGFSTSLLQKHYPHANIISLDPAISFLKFANPRNPVCTGKNLPIKNACADLLFSNFELAYHADLNKILSDARRVLRASGVIMVSCLGPSSLQEVGGKEELYLHDLHDVGDALVKAGFANPVLDVQHFTITYRDVNTLFYELTKSGLVEKIKHPPQKNQNNVYPVSFEVVFGHAFVPETQGFSADDEGVVRVPISHLRKRQL